MGAWFWESFDTETPTRDLPWEVPGNLRRFILWIVKNSMHHFEAMVETIMFLGIDRGTCIIPLGF